MKINYGLIAAAVVCSIPAAPAFAKTAKECTTEWRADKDGMQARGVTEKAYVEQCRGGAEPTAAAPPAKPAETAPPPAPVQATATGSKTAKECTAEWRTDKAGMQARGVTEKAYVEQCRAGGTTSSPTVPEPKPTAATRPPSLPAATATQAAPALQRQAPTTTAAPAPAPAQQPSARGDTATLEAGQFAEEGSAKARCPSDTVVWVSLPSKVYHFAGTRSYGATKRGAYMCEKDAIAAEDRASKTEKHP